MEHRCGIRHAVRAPVILHVAGRAPVRAFTREVSISGMFIELPKATACGHGVIEVEATLPASAGLRTYRWQAMVIRRTDLGVGLMFDRLRPPAALLLIASAEAGLARLPDRIVNVWPQAGTAHLPH